MSTPSAGLSDRCSCAGGGAELRVSSTKRSRGRSHQSASNVPKHLNGLVQSAAERQKETVVVVRSSGTERACSSQGSRASACGWFLRLAGVGPVRAVPVLVYRPLDMFKSWRINAKLQDKGRSRTASSATAARLVAQGTCDSDGLLEAWSCWACLVPACFHALGLEIGLDLRACLSWAGSGRPQARSKLS